MERSVGVSSVSSGCLDVLSWGRASGGRLQMTSQSTTIKHIVMH
jgi:hypothetical protein